MSLDIETYDAGLAAAIRKLAYARKGCRATRSAALTGQNFTTITAIPWDAEDYDTDGCHDNVSNNTRLTVPSGITRVRLTYAIRPLNVGSASTDWYFTDVRKNGSIVSFVGAPRFISNPIFQQPYAYGRSAELSVVAGDYFEVRVQSQADTSSDIDASSFFEMELIL